MSEPKSMGKFHPGLLNDWDYVNNTDIDPMRVSTSSTEVVHWVCAKCGRRWEGTTPTKRNLKPMHGRKDRRAKPQRRWLPDRLQDL